ncbi:MAG: hypothetical protein IJC43_04050 [Clostridia bacterium]|nr:hypothetical protein [Clostridia bacterium]
MKKVTALLLTTLILLALLAGCSSGGDETVDLAAQVTADPGELHLFADGVDVTDGNITFEQIKDKFSAVELDGVHYYATTIKNLCAYDLSGIQSFFGEATDGFVRYYTDLENAHIAVLQSEDGTTWTQIDNEGTPAFALVLPEGNIIHGGTNVYLLSEPVDFSVPIQVNGTEIGQLNHADFMKKTPVGDQKVTTGLFDGSFKYKFGEATYKGRFLGINYETLVAKLAALNMPIEGTIKEMELYGINGLDKEGKNVEYTLYPDENTWYGNVSFICMYDGMVNNPNVKDIDLGLTAFINGTGQKWITYQLTAINFITE